MVTSAHIESYLRRRCEDELIERRTMSVRERAQALTAIGVLDQQVADAVLDGYATARRLRSRGGQFEHFVDHGHGYPSPLLGELTFRRCTATISKPWGSVTMHSLVTSDAETSIDIRITGSDDPAGNPFADRFMGRSTVEIRDDRRTLHHAHFSGGGDDTELSGRLEITPALRRDTAWLTVLDQRIELSPAPDDVTVEIIGAPDTLSTSERAARYLARCLELGAGTHSHDDQDLARVAMDTFLECGVLARDSLAVTSVPALADLLAGGQPPVGGGRWARHPFGRRGQRSGKGPTGTRLVAVTTPVFDGMRVGLLTLSSTAGQFGFGFRAGGPGTAHAPRHGLPFAVTARDDLGNDYTGEPDSWGSGGDGITGDVTFHTPLDRRATMLDLRLATAGSEAVAHIPLIWDAATDGQP